MKQEEVFEPMALHAKRYKESGKSLYRIYLNEKESKLIEAESAALAVVESGIESVHRVTRENDVLLEQMPLELLEAVEEPVLTNIDSKAGERQEFVRISLGDIHAKEEEGFQEMQWHAMHDTASADETVTEPPASE